MKLSVLGLKDPKNIGFDMHGDLLFIAWPGCVNLRDFLGYAKTLTCWEYNDPESGFSDPNIYEVGVPHIHHPACKFPGSFDFKTFLSL